MGIDYYQGCSVVNNKSGWTCHNYGFSLSAMNTSAERLNDRMAFLELTQEALARRAKISQTAVHKLCTGKAKQTRKLVQIADVLGVNPVWLETGKGNMAAQLQSAIGQYQGASVHDDSNAEMIGPMGPPGSVPVVGTAQLGDDGYWAELEGPAGFGDGRVIIWSKDKNAYALRCRGDSMRPRIQDGEFVVIEPNEPPIPGDEVLVKHIDGRVMVKRFLYEREDRIHLQSVNDAHPQKAFSRSEVELFHKVVAILKKDLWRPD